MLQRLFLIAALWVPFSSQLQAASFEISATVDRNEVELGEPLRYTLTLQVNGRLDFPVQIDPPKFEGFQAQGPGRSDSSSWINGAVTEQHSFAWDLVPIKVGTVLIPPIKANAKDATSGEVIKSTPAFSIKVKRPKNAYNGLAPQAPAPLPTYDLKPQAQAEQGDADDGLDDVKPDRGLPLASVALVFGVFGAVLGLLAWWARRPGKAEDDLPLVKDPRAIAFKQLDAALALLRKGDQQGYVLGVGQALRGYLRQRLLLRTEVTLAEAMKACARKLPDAADVEADRALLLRLELLLYGDAPFKTEDEQGLDRESRKLIDIMERLAGR